jgi:isochorismate pyruvate lyase
MKVNSLEEVRQNIDRIDVEIIKLLGERQSFVHQAACFKRNTDDVKAPARVEAIIAKVRNLAPHHNLDANIAEAVYRTMIDYFIKSELNDLKYSK